MPPSKVAVEICSALPAGHERERVLLHDVLEEVAIHTAGLGPSGLHNATNSVQELATFDGSCWHAQCQKMHVIDPFPRSAGRGKARRICVDRAGDAVGIPIKIRAGTKKATWMCIQVALNEGVR